MSITIAGVEFDTVRYDPDADVLYLHVGRPSRATDFDESPEGHALRFDRTGHLVGITLTGVRADLRAGRPVTVTLPERVEVDRRQLDRLTS
jgi:uncharacterized protein YuzE